MAEPGTENNTNAGNGTGNGTGNDTNSGNGTTNTTPFDWAANGFAGDDLGYIQAKQFKTPADLGKAYKNLEAMARGDENSLIRLPKDRTPAAMREIFNRLGADADVNNYIKAVPVAEGADGTFEKTAAGWAHELGIPVDSFKALAAKFNEYGAELGKTGAAAISAQHAEQLTALKAELGTTFNDVLATVDKVAEQFKMDKSELEGLKQAMGPAKAIKFLNNVGAKLGVEGKQIGDGGDNSFKMTPAAALAKIAALNADDGWKTRFLGGDSLARKESEDLHKLAYPEG